MNERRVFAVVLALSLGLASAAFAGGRSSSNDDAIRATVETKLATGDGSAPFVDVKDGVVTLSGKVRSVGAKRDAIEDALSVSGVTAVEDKLEIARGESDQKVAEAVAKEVNRYPFFTVYDDVSLKIDDGDLTLYGRVTMPYKSQEIERRASRVMGVQSVTNEIQTLPTNIGDQRLRAALAYRIYGNSMFREYASRANPPIHIVVERGRVALTGAVRSEVEKRQAEAIARSTFGVFAVENHLQVGS
jgi:hyperosmotically inducible protein